MCITGETGGFRDHFGAEKKKEKKNGNNIETSQHRDIWLIEEKVNERLKFTTLQRLNFATLQRRNVIANSASKS